MIALLHKYDVLMEEGSLELMVRTSSGDLIAQSNCWARSVKGVIH